MGPAKLSKEIKLAMADTAMQCHAMTDNLLMNWQQTKHQNSIQTMVDESFSVGRYSLPVEAPPPDDASSHRAAAKRLPDNDGRSSSAKKGKLEHASAIDVMPPPHTSPTLRVAGHDIGGDEYLRSIEFSTHLRRIKDPSIASVVLSNLENTPDRREVREAEQLIVMACSTFRGGILAGPGDRDKPLASILAAIHIREYMPNPGFILVVSKTGNIDQWHTTVKYYYNKGRSLNVKILDKAGDTTSATDLVRYDIVVCSHTFLEQAYREAKNFHFRRNLAIIHFPDKLEGEAKRPVQPLHSRLYRMLGKHVSVLVVDDCHEVKDSASLLSEAIHSLTYHTAIVLSGTPISASSVDLYAMLSILPGCPFRSVDHLETFVSHRTAAHEPSGTQPSPFTQIMAGLAISRHD